MAVIKVATQIGDIATDADKDLAFSSDYPCLIEFSTGTKTISTDGSGFGSDTVAHNLGYIPQFFCFVRNPLDTTEWYPQNDGYMGLSVGATTSNLYLTIDYKEPSQSYLTKYFIFANQLENASGTGNDNVSGVLKIAKDGYNADTETDARNMVFFSGNNVYKQDIDLSGTVTMTVNDFINEVTVTHNLGYVPVIFVSSVESFGVSDFAQMLPNAGFGSPMSYSITSTQLKIYVEDWSYSSPYNIVFKYKILRDKIA